MNAPSKAKRRSAGSSSSLVSECTTRCQEHREDWLPVPQRVLQWAARQPGRPAIVDGDRVLDYGQLAREVAVLSARLRTAGAGGESVVALYQDRSVELVIAALAVMTSGSSYLCLDPGQPLTRIRQLVRHSQARLVIAPQDPWHLEDEGVATMVYPDESAVQPRATADPGLRLTPGTLAYVNYTSGSSGEPKGVLIEHEGLANLVDWYRDCYLVAPGDVMTQLASVTFDAFALEVWPCLASGATLHLVPARLRTDPAGLARWLVDTAVTVSFIPTPLAEELLAGAWPASAEQTALRALLVGGDRLHRYPPPGLPFRLYNNYGPTECTVVATCGEVTADPDRTEPPPIGRPIRGVTARVLDRDGRPVPDGTAGELVLSGVGVARGYHGEPSADRFAVGSAGERTYATGDLVRRSSDGVLSFLGRLDGQLSIRGVRVEPAEVEAELLKHASVRQVAVVGHASAPDAPAALVAYVVTDGTTDGSALRRWLAAEVPEYLVPAALICLDAVPVDCHGKIDRESLARRPLPFEVARQPSPDVAAHPLSAVWRDALAVAVADPEAHFFECGGDSLRLIRLVSRARAAGFAVQPEDVYEHPVLSDLIRAVGGRH